MTHGNKEHKPADDDTDIIGVKPPDYERYADHVEGNKWFYDNGIRKLHTTCSSGCNYKKWPEEYESLYEKYDKIIHIQFESKNEDDG